MMLKRHTLLREDNWIDKKNMLSLIKPMLASPQHGHVCHPMPYLATGITILGRELGPSGISLNNTLGENLPSRHWNMFNLRLCNAATIRYSLLKFGHMHLCGKDYNCFSLHCCKCNSFGCIAAIRRGNACHGPHNDSVYSGSEHR